MQRRVCVWVRDIDFLCWVLLTSAVDVVSMRKFPVKVYGLVLYLCWIGNVCNGLVDGVVVGFLVVGL